MVLLWQSGPPERKEEREGEIKDEEKKEKVGKSKRGRVGW